MGPSRGFVNEVTVIAFCFSRDQCWHWSYWSFRFHPLHWLPSFAFVASLIGSLGLVRSVHLENEKIILDRSATRTIPEIC